MPDVSDRELVEIDDPQTYPLNYVIDVMHIIDSEDI